MNIKSIPERWTSTWSANDSKPWVDLYKANATYIDHAFQIRRSGHKVLDRHHKLWRTANPDFIMTLASPIWWSSDTNEQTGNGTCTFRTINKGTLENDLLSLKASGKKWEFRGAIDMVIEDGFIKELNEWYTQTPFADSKAVEQYHSLSDEDL